VATRATAGAFVVETIARERAPCSCFQAHPTGTEETVQMIVHVVLFRLKPNLPGDARDALAAALARATREIPSIRHARVGSRVTIGRAYEQLMTTDYSFAAMLEFDDRDGLQAYLDHGAHEQLAQRFYASVDQALTYDFEMWESDDGIERIRRGA
jgi:stress responsive alpha/beta barrel protein